MEAVKQLNELTNYDLKTIAKLREIKNYNNLTREDLICVLFRLAEAPQEDNYLQYLDNTTDSELKKRINFARILSAKLGNILTNKERKAIRGKLYKLEDKKLTKAERQRKRNSPSINLTRSLEDKQKYHSSTYHNQNYYGIKETICLMRQLMITTNQS